jgi:DNA-binding NarL/FixJ family response regulator
VRFVPQAVTPERANAKTRKVLIVDDHPIVREGLRRMIDLTADLSVCAEAATEPEARMAIRECMPDIMIVDISLGQGDGFELVRDVHAHYPSLPMLVLSMHDEIIYAERMLAAGARGYVMKQAAPDELLVALREILNGGIYVGAAIAASLSGGAGARSIGVGHDPIGRLSNRELQVLSLIGRGQSSRVAAQALSLSVKTVETHRQTLKRKLNLASNGELLQYAINWSTQRGKAPAA